MIEENAAKMMEEMENAQKEVAKMIKNNKPKGMKEAFVTLMEQHQQNSQQAINDLSLLYLLVEARVQLEPETCSFDKFAEYVEDFASSKDSCLDYYRHNLQPLTYMKSLLKNLTRDELYEYTKAIGLKGCSNLKKQELLETLCTSLCDPEIMEQQLLGVSEEAIALFDLLTHETVHRLTEKEKDLIMHFPFAYICKSGNDDAFVCKQVKLGYRKIDQTTFQEKREKQLFLNGLSYLIEHSYGFLKAEEAMELVHIHPLFATCEQTDEIFEQIVASSDKALVYENGYLGKPSYLKDANFAKADVSQQMLPLGIPSLKEIMDLGYYHFPYFQKSYKKMLEYAAYQGVGLEDQHEMMQYLYQQLAFHHEVSYGLKLFGMYGLDASSPKAYSLVKDMLLDTRCLTYHGLTVAEFEASQKKTVKKKEKKPFVPLNSKALEQKQLMERIHRETNGNPFAKMLFQKIQNDKK